MAVSMRAAATPIQLSAAGLGPVSSISDTAAPSADAPKCHGSTRAYLDQTGIAVAPIRTPV